MNTTEPKYKTISVDVDHYKDYEVIRKKWSDLHNASISMPGIIKIAMDEYKSKIGVK
jgi:hypothetical protein